MKKINLGCGPSGVNGWINYDWGLLPFLNKFNLLKFAVKLGLIDKSYLTKWPKFDLVDIRKRLPVDDDSINFIYCSHVLEHFERWEAKNILMESKRVLTKGGVIRIVLPDIDKLVKKYEEIGPDEFCRIWWGFDKDKVSKSFFGKLSRYFIRGHQWMYNKKSFKNLLRECGFKNIKFCSLGKGRLPNLDKLDIKSHKDLSFYCEVEK